MPVHTVKISHAEVKHTLDHGANTENSNYFLKTYSEL